jgi:hypothetical protein
VSVKKRSAVSAKIRCLWHDWTWDDWTGDDETRQTRSWPFDAVRTWVF